MPSLKSKSLVLLASLAVVASGCGGSINQSSLDKITTGMTQEQVEAILGTGKEQTSNSIAVPGLNMSGKTLTWADGQKTITVTFANGKVVSKMGNGLS